MATKKLLDIDGVKALVRALEPYLGGDSTIEVLPFEECRAISSVNTSTLTATEYMVYYDTTTNRFVAINASGVISSSPTYYGNWSDATPYKDEEGRNAPTKGKLYVDAQGRVYAAVGGKLREIREPWMFTSYSSGTAAPDGFVTYAKAGDPVMLGGDSTLRRAGFVLYRTSSFIYIIGATYQGIYIYYVSTSTGKLSTSSSNVFSSYATTTTVTNLTTRVATLESQKRWIDVTMWIENSDVNHIENDIQSWNIAAMLNMSLAEIASYEGVRITDGYGQRYYLRWGFISDDTTEIRCSDFYYKGARFAAWIDDERLINLKYKETI